MNIFRLLRRQQKINSVGKGKDRLSSTNPDFIVVGGGTNGLSAAAYLGEEGYSTLVLERQEYIGGGAVTQELTLPGFKHDIFATSINIWRASSIQQDLELEKYGYKDLNPDPVASTPFRNGKGAISIYRDLELTLKSISRFSQKDAEKFRTIYDFYLESRDILLGSLASAPVPFSSMMNALEGSDTGLDFLQFSYMSARDWLEENFESEEMRAFLSLWGSNHVPLSPEDAGSAILMLVFVGLLQDRGAGVPIGGIATVARALGNYVLAHGGTIVTGEAVDQILVRDGRVEGVHTKKGRSFGAKQGVIASVEPQSLFLNLVSGASLEKGFLKKVRDFRYSKVTQVMIHAALDSWLDYDPPEVRRSGLVQIGESLDEISRAYNDCVTGRPPSEPFMTIDNTTCYDSTRAPAGKHVLWNFVRAPVLVHGKPWTEDDKEKFADACMNRLAAYAPNANEIVLKRVVLSPQDIQSLNPNMVWGDPNGGKGTSDQALALRPFPNWSEYRTPVHGLYMCSPATHPGGGVSGLCGHNAAMIAIEDARANKPARN
jgi:phytoene dehydrogenase-like protein